MIFAQGLSQQQIITKNQKQPHYPRTKYQAQYNSAFIQQNIIQPLIIITLTVFIVMGNILLSQKSSMNNRIILFSNTYVYTCICMECHHKDRC